MGFILILVMFALFWAFLIRPKQRELKRHQSIVSTLDVGDEVMTGSGFYGVITEVDPDTVLLELAPGLEVKLARRAVAAKVAAPAIEAQEAREVLPAELDEHEATEDGTGDDDAPDPDDGPVAQ
jgi:preprotein translocase subunit YajC